jgi:group I intron endonuclease
MKNKVLDCGIYKIENLINGKCYIGQSIVLQKRKNIHLSNLRRNVHKNTHLQNSFNKYGEKNFIFKIILYCEPNELTRYEQFFSNYYKMLNLSYNIRECIDSNSGLKHTEESKEKMSISNKGKVRSEEYKRNMSVIKTGKHLTEEQALKRVGSQTGEKGNFFGRKHTKEAKDKVSKANSGRKFNQKTREKMSNSRKYSKNPSFKDKESVLEIRKLLDENLSVTNICNLLHVSEGVVYKVKNGYYKDAYGI